MGAVFVSRPGRVVVLTPDVDDAPLPFAFSGWEGPSFKAIVTSFSGGQADNFQMVQSLGETAWATSLGSRPGRFRVAGVAFVSDCGNDGTTGLEYVQSYFDANRAANNSSPMTIAVGTTASGRYVGFLTGLDFHVDRPEDRLCQFGLQFDVLPRRTAASAAPAAGGGGDEVGDLPGPGPASPPSNDTGDAP